MTGPPPPVIFTRHEADGPESLSSYTSGNGYMALCDVFDKYTPEQVVELIIESGLTGRGGGLGAL